MDSLLRKMSLILSNLEIQSHTCKGPSRDVKVIRSSVCSHTIDRLGAQDDLLITNWTNWPVRVFHCSEKARPEKQTLN